MSSRRHIHAIRPGDHYSPRTGSAIATVVNGLCRNTPAGEPAPAVVVRRDTYPERYDSADIIEYDGPRVAKLGGERVSRYLDGGLGTLGLPRFPSRRELAPMVRDQETWEPSIVFAHNSPQLVPLIDADRHVPVLYAHNDLLRSYRTAESHRVLRNAAAIIAVSDALAEDLARHLPPYLRNRIRVVRNGVDFEMFRRPTPRSRSDVLKILFIGRMFRDKGADVLVDAVVGLNRKDIHLTLVGSNGFDPTHPLTSYERGVRDKMAGLGDRGEVHRAVPRDRVPALLHDADVVVVPSRWPEPFALTVLEGMAAGAAVIGSDIGGIPETVRDVGILVKPDDSRDLATAIAGLADDETLLRSTAQACESYARQHDWAMVARELRATLDKEI